ncbi:MAG: haloalkane dehalogenase [Ilumatobacteraceae bacterium]|nr:haloalkane dehalogenase [Ilumatobacteraceae bacterium]
MQVLRTPDDRFTDLPDFPYEPHYVEIPSGDPDGPSTLRVHYLDVGTADAAPVLLMHGEPTWSYLYRHMIPTLVAAGHRCIVPDLVGFGRSDKPAATTDYSYQRHVDWMSAALFDALDLHDITFFGQDWGSLVGLRLVAAQPERFARVVIGNGGMPDGERPLSEAFMAWQKFSKESPGFVISQIINGGCATDLPPGVLAAYDAPFPDETYKVGSRIMPSLVPTGPDDPAAAVNQAAWRVLDAFEKPFLLTFSDGDPITKGGERVFLRRVPGTNGQPHVTIEGASHFLQEDKGPELAAIVNDFIASTH